MLEAGRTIAVRGSRMGGGCGMPTKEHKHVAEWGGTLGRFCGVEGRQCGEGAGHVTNP